MGHGASPSAVENLGGSIDAAIPDRMLHDDLYAIKKHRFIGDEEVLD